MKVIYIAGKYRGPTAWAIEQNIRAAEDVAARVLAMGHMPLATHPMTRCLGGIASEEFMLAGTLELMRRCDAVVLVPNWRDSEGARAEVAEAERLGLPVFGKEYARNLADPTGLALDDFRTWLADATPSSEVDRLFALMAVSGDPDGIIAARIKGLRAAMAVTR